MFEYFLIFSVIVAVYHGSYLSKIVAFECLASLFVITTLEHLASYTEGNLPLILILRNLTVLVACWCLYRLRSCRIDLLFILLYFVRFLYNAAAFYLTFVGVVVSEFDTVYILSMRLIMVVMAIALIINAGGGIKNYLANRLFINVCRTNSDNTSSRRSSKRIDRMRARVNKFRFKS